jgi:proteasome accessory factor A
MQVPKIIGADIELGNFLLGPRASDPTGPLASRLLLAEFDGVPSHGTAGGWLSKPGGDRIASPRAAVHPSRRIAPGVHARDWGRKFLPTNGGCVYIDSDHLEMALPECRDAWTHVAQFHAMLRLVQGAQRAAGARLPEGITLEVLANTSDGLGASYGAHLDFLISRTAFDDLIDRKPHYLGWLASFQVSAIVLSGQGTVDEAGDFLVSQRAAFFDRLMSHDTMARRGIVNRRDESLCGGNGSLARLHVIFFDDMLSDVSRLVTVGAMQIALAMLEAGAVGPALMLEDPVEALTGWNRDPSLRASARLVDGRPVTAVALQRLFFEEARRFVHRGGCDAYVPGADAIVAEWGAVLDELERRDWDALATKLDWVLKRWFMERVQACRPAVSRASPEMQVIDHAYASLGDDGLFLAERARGSVRRMVPEEQIEQAMVEPPVDTRAWTRTHLLRRWGRGAVHVDWDAVEFEIGERWSTHRIGVVLDDPGAFTREHCAALLDDAVDLESAARGLGGGRTAPQAAWGATRWM